MPAPTTRTAAAPLMNRDRLRVMDMRSQLQARREKNEKIGGCAGARTDVRDRPALVRLVHARLIFCRSPRNLPGRAGAICRAAAIPHEALEVRAPDRPKVPRAVAKGDGSRN